MSVNDPQILACIILMLGIVFMTLGVLKINRFGKKQCTIPSKAVVQEIILDQYDMPHQTDTGVIIKFPTKELIWVNGKINDSTTPSLYKLGESVDILYNEANPNDFVVVSKKQTIPYIVFITAGTLFFVYGIFKLIQIRNNIN